jgi:hypothetical protein
MTDIGDGLHPLPYRKPIQTISRSHDNAETEKPFMFYDF